MASVVFMRGVNVGGHKKFHPSVLARELADFDVVNVGAAGTFVVRRPISQADLRAEILRRLPFEAELMISPGRNIVELVCGDSFPPRRLEKDVRPFVTVMAKPPRALPRLPFCQPSADRWEVKVVAVNGRFALSLWRKMGRGILYPNEVVEKYFGVAATTRGWNTITTILELLGEH
jgi:uncharacterized protein (DUF1697 family)